MKGARKGYKMKENEKTRERPKDEGEKKPGVIFYLRGDESRQKSKAPQKRLVSEKKDRQ